MEVTALCFRLLMLEFLLLETQVQSLYAQQSVSGAASLHITPDRLQFFELERVSFHCDGTDGSAQLKGIKDDGEFTPACIMERTSLGLSCKAAALYPADSGEYWCETEGGERSNSINIIITGGSVILESPALPVMEGDNVTLRCRKKATSTKAVFYKDNVPMTNSSAQEIKMNNVSKSDEGLYKCSIQGVGESPESRLTVTELHRDTCTDTSRDTRLFSDNFIHVLLLMRIIFTVVVMVLQLLLLGRLQCGNLGHSQKKLDD